MDHFEGNENEVSTGVVLWLVGYVLDNYYRNHFERLRNYGRRFSQFGWYRLCFILSQIGTYVANRVTNKIEQIDDRIFMCRSGSAADTQKIGEIIRQNLDIFRFALLHLCLCLGQHME